MADLMLGFLKPGETCACSVNSPAACSFVVFGGNFQGLFLRLSPTLFEATRL